MDPAGETERRHDRAHRPTDRPDENRSTQTAVEPFHEPAGTVAGKPQRASRTTRPPTNSKGERTMNTRIRRIAVAAVAFTLVVLAAAPALAAEGQVNVNTATAAELERLPGVGPSLAARIVEQREKNGAFKQAEDLMLVRGIGEKSFAKMQPYVAISGATTLSDDVRLPRAKKDPAAKQG
jgi:competence ComEA-like helix-hairpin-helix protein